MSKVLRLLSIIVLATGLGLNRPADASAPGQDPAPAPTPAAAPGGPAPLPAEPALPQNPPSLDTPPPITPGAGAAPAPRRPAAPAEAAPIQAPVPAQAPPDVPPSAAPLTRGGTPQGGFERVPRIQTGDAPVDDKVEQVQGKPLEVNPFPPAKGTDGAPAAAPKGEPDAPGAMAAFDNSPDRYPVGRQALALSVEVEAPQVINLGQEATIKIYVGNNGQADARGVRLSYYMPKGLELISSQPTAIDEPNKPLYWNLATVSAGGDPKQVTLRVKAVGLGKQDPTPTTTTLTVDHIATVTLISGARSRTVIQEPKLKVEAFPTPGKVLKGQQAVYKIVVSNPGSGPARKVNLEATLSQGLEVPSIGRLVSKSLGTLQPNDRVEIEGGLIVDAIGDGDQFIKFVASSPDVQPSDQSQIMSPITVVAPKLAIKLNGQTKRYTNTINDYDLIVKNEGTSAARNVRVEVMIPVTGGKLYGKVPEDAEWNKETRKLSWLLTLLEAGEQRNLKFQVRMGGPQTYQVAASAMSGNMLAKDTHLTDISGIAVLALSSQVEQRVIDLGGSTFFDIKVTNDGTKEATKVNVEALLSDHFDLIGTDHPANKEKDKPGIVIFDPIDRIPPGGEVTLSIQVKSKKPGVGSCRIALKHDDQANEVIEDIASTKITSDTIRQQQ